MQLLYVPFLSGLLYAANAFSAYPNAGYIALVIHVFSWIMQFYGHGKHEKRSPALLDNLVQALVLAPLFVWLELLFLLGYRPELHKKIDADAKKAIADWRAGKGKVKSK